jgi:conjugal transfer pilus assembly protein TraL
MEFETRIPRYLNSQPQILWWEMDEIIVIVAGIGLGIVLELLIVTVPLGLLAARLLARVKAQHGQGWIIHYAWWRGIPLARLTIPNTHRDFWG